MVDKIRHSLIVGGAALSVATVAMATSASCGRGKEWSIVGVVGSYSRRYGDERDK